MEKIRIFLQFINNNRLLSAFVILITLTGTLFFVLKRFGGFILTLFSRRRPIKVTTPSNNIYRISTIGRIKGGNLIEAKFYISVNLTKRRPENINITLSDIKFYPEKEIKGANFDVNPIAYTKRIKPFTSFRDLSLKDTNTIIYFCATISFKGGINSTSLEEYRKIPIFLCFNLSVPGYLDNKPFKVPMKNFFFHFIKEFKK